MHTDDDDGFDDGGHTIADPAAALRIAEHDRRVRTEEALKTVVLGEIPVPQQELRATGAQPVPIDTPPLAPPSASRSQVGIPRVNTAMRQAARPPGPRVPPAVLIAVGVVVGMGAVGGVAWALLQR